MGLMERIKRWNERWDARVSERLWGWLPEGERASVLRAFLGSGILVLAIGLFVGILLAEPPVGRGMALATFATVIAMAWAKAAHRFVTEANPHGKVRLACPGCLAYVDMTPPDWRNEHGVVIPDDASEVDVLRDLAALARRRGCPRCGCRDLVFCVPPERTF
jgi:hypothetical protein